jgi:hypothetical protein
MITGHNSMVSDHVSSASFLFDISADVNVDTFQIAWDDAPAVGDVNVSVINLSGSGPGSLTLTKVDVDTFTRGDLANYRNGSDQLQIKITLSPFDSAARLASVNIENN